MKRKAMLLAAVLVVAIAAVSTSYALSDSTGSKTLDHACAEQAAPQAGYKVVSFNPLTIKAMKPDPWPDRWPVSGVLTAIRGLCTGATESGNDPFTVP
jgi:hypothetical protein